MSTKGLVLAVDDTPESLTLLTKLLESDGYEVCPAISGSLALDAAKMQRPDLVLLDAVMPGMDGYEFCKRFKAQADNRDVPVIFISASSDTAEKLKGFAVGAVDYVTKPYQRAELLARVQLHLQLYRLRNKLEDMIEDRTRSLRESEERYRALFDHMQIGFTLSEIVHDDTGRAEDCRFLAVNPVFLASRGLRREDLMGKRLTEIYPCAEKGSVDWIGLCATVAATGKAIHFETLRHDSNRWDEVTVYRPAPNQVAILSNDISDRRRMEEALRAATAEAERASLAKSKFLAAAAHDLRQPMQSLFLFAHALHGDVTGERGREKLAMVERGLETLKGLLDSLLDVSSLDMKVLQPHVADVPLAPLLQDAGALYAPRAAAMGLGFRVVADGGLRGRSDATLLGRMIRNLVENAIRFTDHGGVELLARAAGEEVHIEVRDSGIGIPVDQLGLIFDEFHQVGNPERDRVKGLGLGLSIVQRLARLLDHPVEVKSEIGRGSVFTIQVPAAAQAAEATPEDAGAAADRSVGQGRFAVLVDDDAIVLAGLRVMFGEWGYETLAASSTEQALEGLRAAGRVPDLVVADYRLRAGRVGTETILAVRALARQPVAGILLTGEVGSDCERDAAQHGFGLIRKPVTPRQLYSEVERVASRIPRSAE